MERLLSLGAAPAIGVCNFDAPALAHLLRVVARAPVALLQSRADPLAWRHLNQDAKGNVVPDTRATTTATTTATTVRIHFHYPALTASAPDATHPRQKLKNKNHNNDGDRAETRSCRSAASSECASRASARSVASGSLPLRRLTSAATSKCLKKGRGNGQQEEEAGSRRCGG